MTGCAGHLRGRREPARARPRLRAALEDEPHEPPSEDGDPFRLRFMRDRPPGAGDPGVGASCPYEVPLIWGARKIALQPGDNLLGRTTTRPICGGPPTVSRRHALVRLGEDGATIEDCGSRNGPSSPCTASAIRPPPRRDRILLGGPLLVFGSPERRASTADRWRAAGDERRFPPGTPIFRRCTRNV